MRKKIHICLLFTAVVLFVLVSAGGNSVSFSGDDAYGIISELTSPAYEGRAAGSSGNDKAADYISTFFKKLGYTVTEQPFDTLVPVWEGTPRLAVYDEKGVLVREYTHRVDYSESISGYGRGGTVSGTFILAKDSTDMKKSGSGIVVMHGDDYSYQSEGAYLNSGVKLLIKDIGDSRVKMRPMYAGEDKNGKLDKGFIKLNVTYDVMEELVSFAAKGYRIDASMPFVMKMVKVKNIIASLGAKVPTDETILIGAHFDHLGKDPGGRYFPGALDNASGVSVMMTLARMVSELGVVPSVNVVFAAFNSEEEGLFGSDFYVKNPVYPLAGTTVVNIDMVGSSENTPFEVLCLSDNGYRNSSLIEALAGKAAQVGISFTESYDSEDSDHVAFNYAGCPAVTLNEYALKYYHTYGDTPANTISKARLQQVGDFIAAWLTEKLRSKK